MATLPQHLPEDINAELLLSYYPQGTCKISFSGLHRRNAYNDIVDTEQLSDGTLHLTLSRNSLYNALPEYMFHPIDRFDNIPKSEEKERFEQEVEKQAEEIENAYRFFSPLDLLLFKLKVQVRERIEEYAKENVVMQRIIGDSITPTQRKNRFIKQLLPFLPQCKQIRGNKTLLTILLRKVFLEEGLNIQIRHEIQRKKDTEERYDDKLDMELDNGYVGNEYTDTVTTYSIHYWSEDECDGSFHLFVAQVEELRQFIQDFFLSVEEELHFDITRDDAPLLLSDEDTYHYLNYNTNI